MLFMAYQCKGLILKDEKKALFRKALLFKIQETRINYLSWVTNSNSSRKSLISRI